MFNQKRIPTLLTSAVMIAMIGVVGCQSSVPTMSLNPFKTAEPESEFQQPVRIAVIWKETAVSPPGKKATRGFGGRVYFYNAAEETIKVDGVLTVYAYDDTNSSDEESRLPARKYVFRAADLQSHYGKSGLGDSYNIWLPWDKVGGERKTISLVPVFKPKEGLIPQSDQSIAILSGTTNRREKQFWRESGYTNSNVRQVAMTVPAGAPNNLASRLVVGINGVSSEEVTNNTVRTTTFEIPRSTANRMRLSRLSKSRRQFAKSNEKANEPAGATSGENRAKSKTIAPEQPVRSSRSKQVFGAPGAIR